MSLRPANIQWRGSQPSAPDYDDIYYSVEGADEVRRVFIEPCGLVERAGEGGEVCVLELGFGTGLNLPHYRERVTDLTTVDPNPGMVRYTERRTADPAFPLRHRLADGASLPFPDHTFDTVVSTWTLCSIPDVGKALRELYRVLAPDGRFLFVEHGRSPDPGIRAWQDRLTPIQRRIGDGCHLNRDMSELIEGAGLRIDEFESFYMDGLPKIGGYLFMGSAVTGASPTAPDDMIRSISEQSAGDGNPQSSR